MCLFAIHQRLRDDADCFAALFEHGVGNHAHETKPMPRRASVAPRRRVCSAYKGLAPTREPQKTHRFFNMVGLGRLRFGKRETAMRAARARKNTHSPKGFVLALSYRTAE